tara:strand:+ start:1951 stop:2712 length:762 start_codon:yes stop_codon:yes gene_type:complete
MQYTLFDLTLILFFLSFFVRVIFISLPASQFIALFGRKFREGSQLVKALEIPGFSTFIKQELILGLIPYPLLFVLMRYYDLSAYPISQVDFIYVGITFLVFATWLAFDWRRSYLIYQQLRTLEEKIKKIRGISGNALDGLRLIVHWKGSVRKTALKLGTRAAVGIAKKKVEDNEDLKGKRPATIVALSFIERMVSFPERMTKKLADWAKEQIDEKLMLEFEKYSERTTAQFGILFIWSLLPCIWLVFLVNLLG